MADGGRTDDGEQLAVAVDGGQLPVTGGRRTWPVAGGMAAMRSTRSRASLRPNLPRLRISVYQRLSAVPLPFRTSRRCAVARDSPPVRVLLSSSQSGSGRRSPTTDNRPLAPPPASLTPQSSPRFDPGSQRISVNQWFLSPPARPRRAHARRYRPPVPLPFRPSRRCAVARDSPPV